MKNIQDYETQVYAAVLGKIIGVYLGRPFEGWHKDAIEKKWGSITRYVHEDLNLPLVVADDDISGTFTFIRILSDSGLFAETPAELFGENWLNFLLEGQTILWWGGCGHSTGHTAFLNLKEGIKAPQSGSIEQNGKEVAEQVAAQIFIDAYGMVAPGNPALAVKLAKRSAEVSHGGNAVMAAQVVAAMISIAFTVKDINTVMDEAIKFIPADSLIAQVHRDVRAWAAEDNDWRKTYERIDEKYGYKIYGGNCHVVPNHALMVMAWAYSQNDFFKALSIVNTAGWDTDCNSGNVGSVSALVAGLDHLCDTYDFRTPVADRMLIPTADGTDTITDAMRTAHKIAAIGRTLAGESPLPPPKNGALHHFEELGTVHGFAGTNGAMAFNTQAPACFAGNRCLAVKFTAESETSVTIETPVCANLNTMSQGYKAVSTPWLYTGMTASASLAMTDDSDEVEVMMFVRDASGGIFRSPPVTVKPNLNTRLEWQIEFGAEPICEFGFEISARSGQTASAGTLLIDSVNYEGEASVVYDNPQYLKSASDITGWISNFEGSRNGFSNIPVEMQYLVKNDGLGIMATGNRSWGDVRATFRYSMHSARKAGFLLRYQGLRRYYSIFFEKGELRIAKMLYGETMLARREFKWEENRIYDIAISAIGDKISISIDDTQILEAEDTALASGGFAFAHERGTAGFNDLKLTASADTKKM